MTMSNPRTLSDYEPIEEKINIFDCDGVICMGTGSTAPLGLIPTSDNDLIVTGRSYQESEETLAWLHSQGIFNRVIFNSLPFDAKTRTTSGVHKAGVMKALLEMGQEIGFYYEDDPIQFNVVKKYLPDIKGVLLQHDFTEKENVSHK